jgi:hypothetical protein
MKILNLTHSDFWLPGHFKYMLGQVGHTGETMFLPVANMNAQKADAIWAEHKDYFETFDAIFVSHLSTWSRVFLQNNWTKPLYVWLFFRFDFDIDDSAVYYDLLQQARNSRHNVKFFAATEYDRQYAQSRLGKDFSLDVIAPFVYIDNAEKTQIPSDSSTFYLVGKHNETLFADRLKQLGVPIYRQDWTASVPDLRGVRGVIHLPYVYATRSLYENLALENVYFLPTQQFLNTLRRERPDYFWDGGLAGEQRGDYSLSEWYREENRPLFVYFSSFENLKDISDSPDFDSLIAEKKRNIRVYKEWHYDKTLAQFQEVFK